MKRYMVQANGPGQEVVSDLVDDRQVGHCEAWSVGHDLVDCTSDLHSDIAVFGCGIQVLGGQEVLYDLSHHHE
jgi:hypothetical protein